MKRYVARLDKGNKLAEAVVAEHWTAVAGPHIAEHTEVLGLRNGELLIAVDSPAWATELSAMAEDLRQRVNSQAGKSLVAAMRFTVSQRVEHRDRERTSRREAERRYGGTKLEPVALTESERAVVERSVEAIKDPELREVALNATLRDLEWKKALEAENEAQGQSGGPTEAETESTP
jgi:hypothetical protein